MNYKLALKQVREGKISPIYVCFGQESYLMEEFINGLTHALIAPEHREFAMSSYDLTETSIETVVEDAETLPFMVPRKIVVGHSALFLTAVRGSKKEEKIEHDLERFMSYMQSPVDYTVLILSVQEEKLDERRKIVKWLRDMATVLSFQPLTGNDLAIWISAQCKQMACTIGRVATQQLIQNTGNNLQTLANEIKKMALFAGKGNDITTEIIEQLAVRTLEQNIFKLIDDIVDRRTDRALSLLNDMLQQREEPIKILILIARQFRIIMQVKALHARGVQPQQIASQLKMSPYFVRGALEQGRRYDEHTLANIMSELAELDYDMKIGKIDKVMALETFILKMA